MCSHIDSSKFQILFSTGIIFHAIISSNFSFQFARLKTFSSAHHTNILELGIGLTKIFFIDCKHRTAVQRITVNVELKTFLEPFLNLIFFNIVQSDVAFYFLVIIDLVKVLIFHYLLVIVYTLISRRTDEIIKNYLDDPSIFKISS